MDYRQITGYLRGKASLEESTKIERWLKDTANERKVREILGNIWTDTEIRIEGAKPDFNRLLDRLHHHINLSEKESRISKTNKTIKRIYTGFSRVAAVLLIPIIVFSVYLYLNNQVVTNNSNIAEKEIFTKPGTRTKIELNDGTVVWLNDGTTLKYPEIFSGKERQVFVDGEAYFEVAANPKRPFIVHNPMMTTVVTGTKFNINGYSVDNYFESTLLEGKIGLKTNDGQEIKVTPNQQIQFDKKRGSLIRKEVDPTIAVAWIEGRLILKDELLSVAIRKLSRWYNVDIIIADPELNGFLLTATFRDEKLYQTLDLISQAIPVKYSIETNKNSTQIKQKIYLMKR